VNAEQINKQKKKLTISVMHSLERFIEIIEIHEFIENTNNQKTSIHTKKHKQKPEKYINSIFVN